MFLSSPRYIFILLIASCLGACLGDDPKANAELFWRSVYSNDLDGVRNSITSDGASSIVFSEDVLPLAELKRARIQKLQLEQGETESVSSGSEGLAVYEESERSFILGEPILQNDHILVPTTLKMSWGGQSLVWNLQTRLVRQSGIWKVDFVSLRYGLQQQVESETREALMSEARKFSQQAREEMFRHANDFHGR